MNTEAFRIAKDSYQRGDWAGAASALANAKSSGEAFGEADHLRGNALMKLGPPVEVGPRRHSLDRCSACSYGIKPSS